MKTLWTLLCLPSPHPWLYLLCAASFDPALIHRHLCILSRGRDPGTGSRIDILCRCRWVSTIHFWGTQLLTLTELGHRLLRDDARLATCSRAAASLAQSAVPTAVKILRLGDEHVYAPRAQTFSLHQQVLGAFGWGATGSYFALKVGGGHEGENHSPPYILRWSQTTYFAFQT